MFGCCCVNKKALKKEQQKAAADGEGKTATAKGNDEPAVEGKKNSIKSPQKPPATDAVSLKSPTKNDKSNSSDEDNNLSGLIMSDGLVGEGYLFLIRFNFKQRPSYCLVPN